MISILFPLHTGCAIVAITLFSWRGIMMWVGRPLKMRLFRRTLPDAVDVVFLASGVALAVVLEVSPASPWLAAKLIGLTLYILLGAVALRGSGNRTLKRAAFIGALAAFAYVALVARHILHPWLLFQP